MSQIQQRTNSANRNPIYFPTSDHFLLTLPDFQEILLAHTPADEVVLNLSASVCPLPQPDQVGLDLFTQRLHRGHRRLHVLIVQTVVASI